MLDLSSDNCNGLLQYNYVRFAWRWLGRFLLIIVFCVLLFGANEAKAETYYNPYYNNPTLLPPVIDWNVEYDVSNSFINLNVTIPVVRNDVFNVYKTESGTTTQIFSGNLSVDDTVSLAIPVSIPTRDILIEVRSVVVPPGDIVYIEYKEWQHTFPSSMFIPQVVVDPANPLNPYDIYGFHHNAAIDYYLEHRTYFGSSFDTLKSDMDEVMTEYFEQTEMKDYYFIPTLGISSPLANSLYDTLFNNCFLKYSDSSNINIEIISKIIDYAKDWEANLNNIISANPNAISNDEVKVLLTTSSVLRYSTWYWYNDYNKQNGILSGNVFGDIDVPLDEDGVPEEPPEIRPLFWFIIFAVAIVAAVDYEINKNGGTPTETAAGSALTAIGIAASAANKD